MGSPRCEGETSGRRLDDASNDGEEYTRRRSLRTHRKSAFSRDYVLDIDREIMAIESMPEEEESKVVQLVGSAPQGSVRGGSELSDSLLYPQKRRRGRPRKHPPMAQVASDVPKVKRPRGRPRGSGKHQRAAAAAGQSSVMSMNNHATQRPTASDSAITSGMASGAVYAPSTTSQRKDRVALKGTNKNSPPLQSQCVEGEAVSELKMDQQTDVLKHSEVKHEAVDTPPDVRQVDHHHETPQGSLVKAEDRHRGHTVTPLSLPLHTMDESAETPTPRSTRNRRRKGFVPQKSEI
ncbi:hypothetical protein PSENEW3_00005889 [Picochlorum sp. SENEW3]|nr:hypothetical protein PSENEW3_00005889 [Picochlorum sp. SENEW3]